ncbi:hypothetical protein HanPSC8_Chr14g0605311 [Helianthus annuus]|nr:hypothetical protein HanPSC8_Chr14g0605311 [Helianthus annuus]
MVFLAYRLGPCVFGFSIWIHIYSSNKIILCLLLSSVTPTFHYTVFSADLRYASASMIPLSFIHSFFSRSASARHFNLIINGE